MAEKINIAITFLIIFLVAIFIAGAGMMGLAVFKPMFDVTTTPDDSDLILANNNSAQTLGNTPNLNSQTVQAWNTTWIFINNLSEGINTSGVRAAMFGKNFTVSFWVNLTGKTTTGDPDFFNVNTNQELGMLNNQTLRFRLENTTSNEFQIITTNMSAYHNLWTHIIAIKTNDTNLSLYINGVIVNSSINNATLNVDNLAELDIGNVAEGSVGLTNFSMDEFRIYNLTLTQSEITALFNNGRYENVSALGTINDNNQIFYIPLNENTGGANAKVNSLGIPKRNATIRNNVFYENDGIKLTLTNGTDYTLSGTTFTITNLNYAWSELNVSYVFTNVANEFSPALTNFSQGVGSFFGSSTALFQLLALFIIISLLGLAIFAIYKFVRVGSDDGESSGGLASFFSGGGGSSSSSSSVNMGNSGVGFRTGSTRDGSFSGV